MGKAKSISDLSLEEYEFEKDLIIVAIMKDVNRAPTVKSISKSTKVPMARVIELCEDSDDFIVNVAVAYGNGHMELPKNRWSIEYLPGFWLDKTDVGC